MRAEDAYLFRHAVLRDAAYQLQLPGERARLHSLAIAIVESVHGGRPSPLSLESGREAAFERHALDSFSAELAEHARLGCEYDGADVPALLSLERLYLARGAKTAQLEYKNDEAFRLWQRLASLVDGADKILAWNAAATAASLANRFDEAEQVLRAALDPARGLSRRLEGLVIGSLASIYRQRDNPQAEEFGLRALAMHRESGERRLEAAAQLNLGAFYENLGRALEAEESFTQALRIAREVSDRHDEGWALCSLARTGYRTGKLDRAAPHFEEALAIFRDLGEGRGEGQALYNQANFFHLTGRTPQGERGLERALEVNLAVGNVKLVIASLGSLANLYLDTERFDLAEQFYERAVAMAREAGQKTAEAILLGNTANFYQVTKRFDLSLKMNEAALALHRASGSRGAAGTVLGNLAASHVDAGRLEIAEGLFEEALALNRETRDLRSEGFNMAQFARLRLRQQRGDEAREYWRQAVEILTRIRDSGFLERLSVEMRESFAAAGLKVL